MRVENRSRVNGHGAVHAALSAAQCLCTSAPANTAILACFASIVNKCVCKIRFVDRASLYNLVNKTNLVHNFS